MTIEEAIKQRHSVRKYIHKPLSTEVVRALEEKILEYIPARYDGLRFSCTAGFACISPVLGNPGKYSFCSYIPDILHGW